MRRSDKRRTALSGPLCALLVVAAEARAAQTTWADPLGLCAGELPCFQTISEAVANAGPAPASVFVFPGTYAESVDLATMGAALPGGAPGELALVSVDATGQPFPGAVVDPGAPGGPGAGSAIHALAFPARLELYGFTVRSPDTDALFLAFGTSDVALSRIEAIGSPQGGGILVFQDAGDVAVTSSTAILNGGNGLGAVSSAGKVTLLGCLADRNAGSGIVGAGAEVTVTAAVATANEVNGLLLSPTTATAALRLTGVEAANNDTGLLIAELFATAELEALRVSANLGSGAIVHAGEVVVRDLEALANGEAGLSFAVLTLDAVDLLAEDNVGYGVAVIGADVAIRDSRAAGNRTGFLLGADRIRIEGSSAIGHVAVGPNLQDGVGFVLAEAGTVAVSDSLALANRTGWLILDLDALPVAESLWVEALASEIEGRLTVPEGGAPISRIVIEQSRTEGNLEAAMRVYRGPGGELRVSCSDFVSNGPAGLTLFSESLVDARSNFWRDPSGPTHPANPAGLGDAVNDAATGFAGEVRFAPFLAAAASPEDCPVVSVLEIPTLGPGGIVLLALATAFAALTSRRFRRSRGTV